MSYIAVGVDTKEKEEDARVVIVIDGFTTSHIGEHAARKLADDILRNANYLWGVPDDE